MKNYIKNVDNAIFIESKIIGFYENLNKDITDSTLKVENPIPEVNQDVLCLYKGISKQIFAYLDGKLINHTDKFYDSFKKIYKDKDINFKQKCPDAFRYMTIYIENKDKAELINKKIPDFYKNLDFPNPNPNPYIYTTPYTYQSSNRPRFRFSIQNSNPRPNAIQLPSGPPIPTSIMAKPTRMSVLSGYRLNLDSPLL